MHTYLGCDEVTLLICWRRGSNACWMILAHPSTVSWTGTRTGGFLSSLRTTASPQMLAYFLPINHRMEFYRVG